MIAGQQQEKNSTSINIFCIYLCRLIKIIHKFISVPFVEKI